MEIEINKNEWASIVQHTDILELRWAPSTATMTDGGYMATLCLFAWEAERLRPQSLLVDMVAFGRDVPNAMLVWRESHIVPRYGAAGVRKFAFVRRAGYAGAGKEMVDGSAIFSTQWFVERAAAFTWLADKGRS